MEEPSTNRLVGIFHRKSALNSGTNHTNSPTHQDSNNNSNNNNNDPFQIGRKFFGTFFTSSTTSDSSNSKNNNNNATANVVIAQEMSVFHTIDITKYRLIADGLPRGM